MSPLIFELGLTLIAIALAFGYPEIGATLFSKAEAIFGSLAHKRWLSALSVGVAACLLRLLIIPIAPIPNPSFQDDFSYLLAADTYASGRLANPTHPMWIHFESFHITHQPTYMSMYFPAQGMLLAAGKMVAGHPWYGVLASVGIMCAAVTWMLQAWLPPGWALLGGFLAMLRLGLCSYWIDSYTGGALAAIGGALVLGALPRIWRSFRTRDFFWMALGMAILANSRPYEGLLVCVPAVVALVRRHHPPFSVLVRRTAPAAALLVLTVAFMAYYNYRVFGNALTLPYQINRAMYASTPYFLWQAPRPEPVYRHKVMRDYYSGDSERGWFLKSRTIAGLAGFGATKLIFGLFFIWFALLPPLVMLPQAFQDRRTRFLAIAALIFAFGLAAETFLLPHYTAPFTAGLFAILLQCMRHLRYWRPAGRPSGLFLVRAIPVICLAVDAMSLGSKSPDAHLNVGAGSPRVAALAKLEEHPGRQLAIVRYAPDHDPRHEWVYNAADIDNSRVVWAREMDPTNNQNLLLYFKDRAAWLVEPDANPPRISEYLLYAAAH